MKLLLNNIVGKDYKIEALDLDFKFSNRNKSESINKSTAHNLKILIPVFRNFKKVLENSVLVSVDNDRYEGEVNFTPAGKKKPIENVYTLMSSVKNSDGYIPVRLKVLEQGQNNLPNTLHVVISYDEIKKDSVSLKWKGTNHTSRFSQESISKFNIAQEYEKSRNMPDMYTIKRETSSYVSSRKSSNPHKPVVSLNSNIPLRGSIVMQ